MAPGDAEFAKAPRIGVNIVVRDEIELIRVHLDYHFAQGVDAFLVTDRGSTDGTLEVLREYQQRGVLHLKEAPVDYFAQGKWLTETARTGFEEYELDWVVNIDADEFLWPHSGNLKDQLGQLSGDVRSVEVERQNFCALQSTGGAFYDRQVFRDLFSVNPVGDRLPPKVLHRNAEDLKIDNGAHLVWGAGLGNPALHAGMVIMHFPFRSVDQYLTKITTGTRAVMANPELSWDCAYTWKEMYKLHQQGLLRQHCEGLLYGEEDLLKALDAGKIVRDERLRDFIRKLRPRMGELAPSAVREEVHPPDRC